MAEEHLHDTIEKYLLGELSVQTRERLEVDMSKDPALREQVELQRLGLMGLQRLAAADLRQKFDQWDEDIDVPTPSINPNHNRWFWTAVTLFLLLITGTFWHFWQMGKVQQRPAQELLDAMRRDSIIAALRTGFQQKNDSLLSLINLPNAAKDSILILKIKRLQEEAGQKDKLLHDLELQHRTGKPQIAMQFATPSNTATRGDGEASDPTLTAEKKAFDAKDFAESIRLLKRIPANDPRQAEVIQRLPYSLFYAQDFEAAIPAFLDLLDADQFEEANVQWYLLLCYVATGQKAETRLMLHTILNNKNTKYHQKATDLKKALNI